MLFRSDKIIAGICWLEDMAQPLVCQTHKYLSNQEALIYPPRGILILFDRILNLFQRHLDADQNIMPYDDQFIAYLVNFDDESTSFKPPPSIQNIELLDVNTGMDMELEPSEPPPQPSTSTIPSPHTQATTGQQHHHIMLLPCHTLASPHNHLPHHSSS